jgi:ABC-type phosphate/phosphonate transport system substrate-binding protein
MPFKCCPSVSGSSGCMRPESRGLEVRVSTRAPAASKRELQSRRLLILATLLTLLVASVGSLIMWQLLGSYLAGEQTVGVSQADTTAPPLMVGLARTPGGPGEWRAYAAAFARLEEDMGRPIKLKLIQSHSGVADLLRSGELDIVLTHVSTYLELEQDGAAVLVVAPLIAGEARDRAVLVVAQESSFERVQDLAGGSIVLERGSISSEGCAAWMLEPLGASPELFFGAVEHAESQDTNLEMVARGDADATCVRLSALAAWSDDSFRVLAESPEFGLPPIVARTGLDKETVAQIRGSLVSDRTAAALPAASAVDGFLRVAREDYEFSRVLRAYVVDSESDGTHP